MTVPGRCYRVGGSVRDELLGQAPGDQDWVVVGASPQAMIDAGFRPVGKDFPVFLHPATGEEYALARTERKSAPGYHGFTVHASPEVTLEEDLARRDLTINAMARDADGRLVDPYGGARDLTAGVLRHVSPAFAEDPVRLLRLARFAARWPSFQVAPDTLALLRRMVADGEVAALVPERVWQELARGLMEIRPGRMLDVLKDSGAWPQILPGLRPDAALWARVDRSAGAQAPLAVRYACMACDAPALGEQLRAPTEARELAEMLGRERATLAAAARQPDERIALFDRCDAWRRPGRFLELLRAAACLGDATTDAEVQALSHSLAQAQAVDLAEVSRAAIAEGLRGPAIGQRVRDARRAALEGAGALRKADT